MKSSCLIVGCGYVGRALADVLVQQNWRVGGVIKSDASCAELTGEGLKLFQGDVAQKIFWENLPSNWDHVIYCPSTGGGGLAAYQQIHDVGLRHCLKWIRPKARLFYTSSTSVYSQNDGEWVDETSDLKLGFASAQVLVKAEQRVTSAGYTVLRLGGIYGPDRGVLLKRLQTGKAIMPEQDPKWLNLIYLADILAAIQHGLNGKLHSGEVYNVIDNEPAAYQDIYQWLCDQLDLPLPQVGTPEYFGKRGITNKRVSNKKLRATGWHPQYPSFRDGYEQMLNADKI